MDIYFGGLERSGNVFFEYCLTYSLQAKIISTRSHSVRSLQEHRGIDPFIVPVRDILPSITSAHIYWKGLYDAKVEGFDDPEIYNPDKLIKKHAEYIEYLVNSPRFFIAPFHEFTKDHNKVIETFRSLYPDIPRLYTLTTDEVIERAKSKGTWEHTPKNGNFPRQESPRKNEIKELFVTKHGSKLKAIQNNINILYDRYYLYGH